MRVLASWPEVVIRGGGCGGSDSLNLDLLRNCPHFELRIQSAGLAYEQLNALDIEGAKSRHRDLEVVGANG